ncbi:uncharacterized protein [Typha latifolia]|uniref:uncharacterized protein n=1 Tax=Typha latifolia TaxID=4733 RepID=UPI003C2CD474
MAKSRKSSTFAGRAWRLLRLALLWGRKGGVFKRDLLFDLRVSSAALLKRLLKPGGEGDRRMDRIHYGEREFSFEETPAFRFKTPSMRLPRIPCITPAEDFYFDDDDDVSFFKREEEHLDDREEEEEEEEEEVGIDVRAEEFIAKFYEQIQYNEMLQRSAD